MILSHRLPYPQYETDRQFGRVLEFLRAHRDVVDEICFFSDKTNFACWPLDLFAENTRLMGRRTAQLKDAGFRNIGINLLSTLGHLDDVNPHYPPMVLPVMVGHDGQSARACPCPNSAEYREYIAGKYRLCAEAEPDFIWVDDDFRLHSHTIAYGCFCPRCLAKFDPSIESREQLVGLLSSPEGGAWRERWIGNSILVLEEIARTIERAVHEVSPGIEIGLMTAGPRFSTYSGQAFGRWMRALGGRRVRPGGGFYDDYTPNGMIVKSLDMGQQCLGYPPSCDNVQYELEDFPCQALDKSVQSVLNECTLAMAVGCNGVAFSSLRNVQGTLDDYRPLYSGLSRQRPVWEALVPESAGLPLVGLWPASSDEVMAKRRVRQGEDWFAYAPDYNMDAFAHLIEVGLPITLDPSAATAVLLGGRLAECLSDERLREILSGGVMLDVTALGILWERGLGHLAGVKPGRSFTNSVWERLTDHSINGDYADDGRWVSQAYFGTTAWELVPVSAGIEEISTLMRFDSVPEGPCLTRYENELGGRVVTMGYLPWTRLTTSGKRAQMLALADWVSHGRLPLIIESPVRVGSYVRMSPDGRRVAIVLLNTSFDPTGPITLRLRARPERLFLQTPDGRKPLDMRAEGEETIIKLNDIAPWQAMVLTG